MRRYSPRTLVIISVFIFAQLCVIMYLSTLDVIQISSSFVETDHFEFHLDPSMVKESDRKTITSLKTLFHEPLVAEDFPTVESTTPLIPHIIHQTYKDVNIPHQFVMNIKSFIEKNQNWTYFFWTDESSRKLVAERYPHFLQIFDDYKTPINRADVIRYFALYEFGGFYSDLDVECIRPLDRLTTKYTCIFPPEPFEQSVFRIHAPYLINNAIMMCSPKHPFLKYMIDRLHQYQVMLDQIDTAGPAFVTSQFIRYNNITAAEIYKLKETNESNSPYFYKGRLSENDVNAVYIPNTQYFIHSLSRDWINATNYKENCNRKGFKTIIVIKACHELQRRLAQQSHNKFAFTDHQWYKSYEHKNTLNGKAMPIGNIVNQALRIY